MAIWYNVWPFGVVCGPLVYFSRIGMIGQRKIWQPCWPRFVAMLANHRYLIFMSMLLIERRGRTLASGLDKMSSTVTALLPTDLHQSMPEKVNLEVGFSVSLSMVTLAKTKKSCFLTNVCHTRDFTY
jgi:hypothetical protein